jgi:signal transduction histidine kinase
MTSRTCSLGVVRQRPPLGKSCRPERIPHYLTIIRESAHDALDYIRQYLETSSGTAQTRADASASLADTLEWLLRRYGMQLEARGIRVHAVPPPRDVRVAIDERVLRQVAENLITNALKYAPTAS